MRRRADLVSLNAGWEICVGWTPISCAGNAKIWVVLPIGAKLRRNFFVGHNPSSDGNRQALTGISNFPEADFWPVTCIRGSPAALYRFSHLASWASFRASPTALQ